MSRRGAAARRPSRAAAALSGGGPSRAQQIAAVVGLLIGMAWGAGSAPMVLERLRGGHAFEERDFTVITPHRAADVKDPLNGRGLRVEAGSLRMVPHAFERAERLVTHSQAPLGRVELQLAEGSAPLLVMLTPPAGSTQDPAPLVLREGGLLPHLGGAEIPLTERRLTLFYKEGAYWAEAATGPVRVMERAAGGVELAAVDWPGEPLREVRIDRVRFEDSAGQQVLMDDFDSPPTALSERGLVALTAGLLGLAAGVASGGTLGGGLLALLGLALPLLVLRVQYTALLDGVERLALVRTTARELLAVLLALASAPVLVGAVGTTGLLRAPAEGAPTTGAQRGLWIGAAALAALIAARDLQGVHLGIGLLGAIFLLLPLRAALATGRALPAALLRELPGLLVLAVLGWRAGLLPYLLYQLLRLWSEAPTLLVRGARAGADALLLSLLALPLGAELALRETYLKVAWSPEKLAGVEAGADDSVADVSVFWSERCLGAGPDRVIWWLGGSSAGGSYQLEGHPEVYFPAQLHQALCAAGLSVHSVSFANGGRDSFTFTRGLPKVLSRSSPDLVIAYWGVNDVLTAAGPMTRKEREAAAAASGAIGQGVVGLGRRSRLLAGLGLLAKPAVAVDRPDVPAVPLEDARENHARLAAMLAPTGARLLLIPEQARPRPAQLLGPYREMQREFVRAHAEVGLIEPGALGFEAQVAAPGGAERLLVDSNHLSPEGHRALAATLAGPLLAFVQGELGEKHGSAP